MQNYADQVLMENLVGKARLMDAMREAEKDAVFLRRAKWFCGVSFVLWATMLLHQSLHLPALGYIWQFILSLCT
jgi:hypothetical protein